VCIELPDANVDALRIRTSVPSEGRSGKVYITAVCVELPDANVNALSHSYFCAL
jgi:hypothetical protein